LLCLTLGLVEVTHGYLLWCGTLAGQV
jgi:hypothetical protein